MACEQAPWSRMGRREGGKDEDRRERSGERGADAITRTLFSLSYFTLSQLLFGGWGGRGRREYVPRTFAELNEAAILGGLFQGNKIAGNMETHMYSIFMLEVCIKTLLYLS